MNKDPLLLLHQFILCYNYWTKTKAFITKCAPHSKNCISSAPSTCFPASSGITKAHSHQVRWFPAREPQEKCPGCAWCVTFPSRGTAGAAARGATTLTRVTPAAKRETKHGYFKNSNILQTIYTWNLASCPSDHFWSGERFSWEAASPRFQVRMLAGWPCGHLSSQAAALVWDCGKPNQKTRPFRQILSCKKIWGPKASSNFTSIWTKVSHSTYKTSNLFHVSLPLQTIPHPRKYNYNLLQNSLLFWHRLWIYNLQQLWGEQVKPPFKFYLWVIKNHVGFTSY